MKKKFSWLQLIRHLVQLAAFIFIPGLFIEIFSGIGAIVSSLIGGSWTWASMGPRTIFIIIVLLITAFAGRFFCGYLCSFGAMGDLLHFAAARLHIPQLKLAGTPDKILKYVKYVILGAAVIGTWIFNVQLLGGNASPWTVFGRVFTFNHPMFSALLSVGGLLLLLIIAGSLFVERFFCRYLCPLGAIFSLISKLRIYRIFKPRTDCGKCRACTRACSMGIQLREMDRVNSGECINCYKCREICPRKNVTVKPEPTVVAVAASAVLAGCYFAGSAAENAMYEAQANAQTSSVSAAVNEETLTEETTDSTLESILDQSSAETENNALNETETAETVQETADEAYTEDTAESESESEDAGYGFTDGVYTGYGTGFRGTTQVTVTVEGGTITDIQIDSYQDDGRFFNQARSTVISEVLSAQSVDVSTVSGATFSSNGILSAVADALGLDYTPAAASGRRH